MLQQMIQQLEMDASSHGSPPPVGLVVEVEVPSGTTDPALKKARLHLSQRYQEYGFIPLPVTYHEPAFVRTCENGQSLSQMIRTAEPMQLLMLPLRDQGHLSPDLLGQVVDAFLIEHYGLPEDDWIVQQAREPIEKIGEGKNGRNH
jgi:hypothetical protein